MSKNRSREHGAQDDIGVPEHAWIVVADGHSARVLQNIGRDGVVELRERETLKPQDLKNEGPSGSRPQGDSPRDTDEATFAKQLAHWLYQQAHKGAYQKLVLAADPITLGQLRPQLHDEVVKRTVKEMPKSLVTSSIDDIIRSVRAAF